MTIVHATQDAISECEFPDTVYPTGGWACPDGIYNEDWEHQTLFASTVKKLRAAGQFEMPQCPICASLVLEALSRYTQRLLINHQLKAATTPPAITAGAHVPDDSP